MDSSVGYGQCRPTTPKETTVCPFHQFNNHRHHHHWYHVSPHCPLHSYMLHLKNHSPKLPVFASSYPSSQNPETLSFVPFTNPSNLQLYEPKEAGFNTLVMQDENEELEEEEEQEEEDDPVFVLTDEWREFFAKSEAKRRLAKKQAKKKGKDRMEQ